jgi:hypothetical protein
MKKNSLFLSILFLILSPTMVNAIMLGEGYPWEKKLNSPYDKELSDHYPNGGWFLNLGPTGIRAKITPEKPTQLLVKFVFQDKLSPAKGKVFINDIIVGANGKKFKTPHLFGRRGNKKGWDGPMMELSRHLEDSQATDGQIKLMVWPKGNSKQEKVVIVQLEKELRFADTYPFNCERSEKMAKELCDFLYENNAYSRGRPHARGNSILALMANGYKEHEKAIKSTVSAYGSKRYAAWGGGFQTWGWGYDGILMGEHYLLYKDKKVIPAIESLNVAYYEGTIGGSGSYTHRSMRNITKLGKKPYASIAGISGLAMTAMSLFKKGGIDYNPTYYEVIHKLYLNAVTPSSASIAYGFVNKAPDNNKGDIKPRHAILQVVDPKKGLSGKGPGYTVPGGMKNIGKYKLIWPTKKDPRWKSTDWVEDESEHNIITEENIPDWGKGMVKVQRNNPKYKKPSNPEPKKAYKTTGEAGHPLPVGLGAAAHLIGNDEKESWGYLGKHYADTAANSYEHLVSGHASAHIHAFWTIVGASKADPKKLRVFLDYLKSFLILGQTHNGGMIIQPWGRDRPNCNSDVGYGPRILPTASAAILLSLSKKRLQITGANTPGSPNLTASKSKSRSKISTAKVTRQPFKFDKEKLFKVNKILLATLNNLSKSDGIKKVNLTISVTKKKIILVKADNDLLTFKLSTGTKKAKFKFDALTNKDRAVLACLIAESNPTSKTANALAVLYQENFGSRRVLNKYIQRTNSTTLKKVENIILAKKR